MVVETENLKSDGARRSASVWLRRMKEAAMADSDFQAVTILESREESAAAADTGGGGPGRHEVIAWAPPPHRVVD
jgi:hypothetical protein